MTAFSLLDLVHVREVKIPADALADALLVAQRAEQLDNPRYQVAEHHNMIGIPSAATSVVIGHLVAGTSKFRVGSDGIMLPNHSPLQIAEQFGSVIVADTDEEARYLYTTLQQIFVGMLRGRRGLMPAPMDSIGDYWSLAEKAQVSHRLSSAFVGSPETVHGKLEQFLARTHADELMISAPIFDHQKRLRSIELLAELGRVLG